mmetsp:Transcript_12750/g.32501  ORF Transcript_12750/g.32501 Transcript_12750/m.32501 type:complete len:112 (-) Transcript_12750:128-463(-)
MNYDFVFSQSFQTDRLTSFLLALLPIQCTLVVLVHGDAEEDTAVLTAISRLGDLTIFVDPLRRGRSQEVHGQLTLRQREIPRLANTTAPTASLLHFRLTDRTVHVFLPGSK